MGRVFMAAAAAAVAWAPAAPAEAPSFLDVVRRYADTMIEKGRDTYGTQKSGLFLSALDRMTLAPLTTRPAPPGGMRREDRVGPPWEALVGANPHLDENLLRVLCALSDITGDARYRQAVDEEIAWFFNNAQSKVTGLMPWGEHMFWNVLADEPQTGMMGDPVKSAVHEFSRPWMFWDRTFELAPEPGKRFALGLWNHQIANHQTGGFDRHAPYFRHGPVDGKDFARHAGFYIHTWGFAYKHTKDETFLKAIDVLLARFEKKRHTATGDVATIGPLDPEAAAACVPDPLAKRLRDFADSEDALMLAELSEAKEGKGGSAKGFVPKTFVPTWQAGYSSGTAASSAMYYLARYEQVHKEAYRDVIVAIADAFVGSRPGEDVDVWPMTVGHTISAEVAAYRFTKKQVYLDEARALARWAVDVFWEDNPLPRASFKTGHYETLSGADTLALSLLDVYAAERDVKTPIPVNGIDR